MEINDSILAGYLLQRQQLSDRRGITSSNRVNFSKSQSVSSTPRGRFFRFTLFKFRGVRNSGVLARPYLMTVSILTAGEQGRISRAPVSGTVYARLWLLRSPRTTAPCDRIVTFECLYLLFFASESRLDEIF